MLAVIGLRTHNGRLDPDTPYVAVATITLVVVRLHQIVRRQAGLARALATALDEQRRLASTDSLTGAPNRRAFDILLESAVTRAAGGGGAVGVVILDFDQFKRINDGFGHPAGDEVLRMAVARLRGAVRESDEFARIGGEEFAIIASDVDEAGLDAVAERCREVIGSTAYDVGGQEVMLTTSAGTAHYPTDARSAESLVQLADRALYQAKRNGGNRVHAGSEGVHIRTLPVPDNTALSFLGRLADQLDRGAGRTGAQPSDDGDRSATLRPAESLHRTAPPLPDGGAFPRRWEGRSACTHRRQAGEADRRRVERHARPCSHRR